MLRTLFCTGALLALTLMHATAAPPAAAAPLPRLAVVCLDDNDRTKTLADLVQLELGKSGKVDMVERAEFARVLAEQNLSAAGLTGSGAQIAVGKALRADALLLLDHDGKLKAFRGRLTDTQYAAQLCRVTVPSDDAATVEEASTAVSKAALAALPKLTVPLAQRLLVTVLEIRNGTLSKDCAWVETEVPDLLETALILEPRVFVLDRQRLRELLKEVQSTAGNDAAFSTGAILVDGDVALKPGVALGQGVRPVVFAIRLRDGALAETGRVQAESTLDKVRELLPKLQTDLVKKIAALGPQKPVSVETEKRLLQEASDRAARGNDTTRAVVFAEAAHGLDAKDPQAVQNLLDTLYREFARQVLNDGSPKAMQDAVDTVLRIDELALVADAGLRDYTYSRLMQQQSSILSRSFLTWLTKEQRAQLRPVRQRLRETAERMHRDTPVFIVRESNTFFEDPVEHNVYVCSLFQRILDPAVTPPARRSWFIAEAFRSDPLFTMEPSEALAKAQAFVDQLTRHDDCVVRYYALECATVLAQDKARQKAYATQALALLPEVLARDDLFANNPNLSVCHPLPRNPRTATSDLKWWSINMGLDARDALARIETLYNDMLDKGEFTRYANTRPEIVLPDMEPAAAIRLIDRAAGLADRLERESGFVRTPDMPPVSCGPFRAQFGHYLATAATARIELANRSGPDLALAASPGRKVLLCTQSPESKALFAAACRKWGEDPEKFKSFTPWRLLVDGDTLWIVFSSPGVLLVQMDLASRRVLRTWIGEHITDPQVYRFSVWYSAMCFWGNDLCLGSPGQGVHVVPVNAGTNTDEIALDEKQNGLLDPAVTALAPLGEDLYIGTASGLWRYNRKTRQTELLASNNQQTVGRRLRANTVIRGLVPNAAGTRLYLVGTIGSVWPVLASPACLYRFDTVTGKLTDLAGTPVFQAFTSAMGYGAPRPTRADPTRRGFDPYRACRILDAETETVMPERGALPLLPEDLGSGWTGFSGLCFNWWDHVVFWKGDAILIRRSISGKDAGGPVWSIEQLSGLPMPAMLGRN